MSSEKDFIAALNELKHQNESTIKTSKGKRYIKPIKPFIKHSDSVIAVLDSMNMAVKSCQEELQEINLKQVMNKLDNAIKRYCETHREYNFVKMNNDVNDIACRYGYCIVDTLTGTTVCGFKNTVNSSALGAKLEIGVITFDNQ